VQAKLIALAAVGVLALVGVGCSDASGGMGPGLPGGAAGPGSGGAGATGGAVGSGGVGAGGAVATPVVPTAAGTLFTLQIGDVSFVADSSKGGRITTFGLPGLNLLTGPELSPNNYGSTFWPAPQTWPWPPPEPIDQDPYLAQIAGNEIVMQGNPDPTTGISVEKRFSADTSGWVTQTFTMTNTSGVPQSWAPWQVTRVAKAGYSFFPTGPGGAGAIAGVTTVGAETWLDAAVHPQGTASKLFADGSGGWFAHATGSSLFVKRFPDLDPALAAPNEAEVEIYSDAAYMELEIQGPFVTLNAGESQSWTIYWKVVPLAAPLSPTFAGLDTASLAAQAAAVAAERGI
jgi:hypothetical protein